MAKLPDYLFRIAIFSTQYFYSDHPMIVTIIEYFLESHSQYSSKYQLFYYLTIFRQRKLRLVFLYLQPLMAAQSIDLQSQKLKVKVVLLMKAEILS